NCRNRGGDPVEFLRKLPLDRLAYVHIAGGEERDGVYHDSHAAPAPPGVLELLANLCSLVAPPGVMLERDDHFPTEPQLNAELDAIQSAAERGRSKADVCHAG
ncbi:MAG TPA: DUF692 family protein, partial [Tepidisphaeraceae bacterium]|nr:DUF692 family protein [Tepidisphaeraceae bacterium]